MPTMWLSDTQKIGVAFCSGGGLFLMGGVMMFFDRAMLAMGNVRRPSLEPPSPPRP
ncbi:Got1 family protein [Pyrenophora tritici-repentis]|nr:Got1 family protein [Pyrenophora tritici-repentis]